MNRSSDGNKVNFCGLVNKQLFSKTMWKEWMKTANFKNYFKDVTKDCLECSFNYCLKS